MGLSIQLALVPDDVQVPFDDIAKVAAALSKQVNRDFRPIWNVDATVDAYARLEDVPTDYWPIIIKRNVAGAAGFHDVGDDKQPFSVVQFGPQWSVTASHECLEMLADPSGNRVRASTLLDQAVALGQPAGRVNYLIEVCDPSESAQFGYQINGVDVSDFYTPEFFDPVKASGVRYSFTGAITAPRQVLVDGYISWYDPRTKHWMQFLNFPGSSGGVQVVDLSANAKFRSLLKTGSVRSAIDFVTPHPAFESGVSSFQRSMFTRATDRCGEAQVERAKAIRSAVAALSSGVPIKAKGVRKTTGRKGK